MSTHRCIMSSIACSEVQFADIKIHQLQTNLGKVFVLGEIATEVFQDNPTIFFQDVKRGRYPKLQNTDPNILAVTTKLGLQVESRTAGTGISLLTAETVRSLMLDKRKRGLLLPFRIALLKLSSHEAATLMADTNYAQALPVAMDAVKEGQDLFKPQPDLRLFPLFLLGAQANLGMKRCKQCEELLALAAWLLYSEPEHALPLMKAQLNRLYGQLHSLMGRDSEALQAFAQDAYQCSLAYGPLDVRTSLAYYNLAKVFQGMNEMDKSLMYCDQVLSIWSPALLELVASRVDQSSQSPAVQQAAPPGELPLQAGQLKEAAEMLKDIRKVRVTSLGDSHASVAEAACVLSLLFICLQDALQADQCLQDAQQILSQQSMAGKLTRMLGAAQAGLQLVSPGL